MKSTQNKQYVSHDRWTGRIYKVSSKRMSNEHLVSHLDDTILDDIKNDRISLTALFVGEGAIHKKDGRIFFPNSETKYTDIEENVESPGIQLDLYTVNKLLDISINYHAVTSWYNRRMKADFTFINQEPLYFNVLLDDKIVKEIAIPINDFLGSFKVTLDLSDIEIDDFSKFKFSTRRNVEHYGYTIQSLKYNKVEHTDDGFFQKINRNFDIINNTEKCMLEFTKTKDGIIVHSNITNPNEYNILSDLEFYVTGNDINYIQSKFVITLKDLWSGKDLVFDSDIHNKHLYCSDKNVTIKIKRQNEDTIK